MGFIDNTTESHQKQLNEIREASKATETKRAIDNNCCLSKSSLNEIVYIWLKHYQNSRAIP